MTTNPYQRYAEANLLSASPLQLVVMLYQRAYDSLNAACDFNRAGDHTARGGAVSNALDVLNELAFSCDESVAITVQLRQLYAYMQNRLIEAHMEQSEEKLREVAGLIQTLLEGWRQIAVAPEEQGYRSEPELSPVVAAGPVAAPLAVAYGRF